VDDHGESLGAFGGGTLVPALGQEWTFLPVTQGAKAEFVAWIKSRIRGEAFAAKGSCSPEEYRELLAAANADLASGRYNWGGEGWAQWVASKEGVLRLALLMLRGKHKDIDEATVEAVMVEAPEAFGQAVAECIKAPPNPRGPVPTVALARG
jgi:hypothetical protein